MGVNGLVDINEMEKEIAVFIKNNDIFSTTTRGVTTTTSVGSWSGDTSQLINRTNIRNIRSITVGGSPIAFGSVYTVDYDYDDSGTIKTKVTMSAQTGDYIITYDYGSDKIYTEWPRDEINISSYPRLAVQLLTASSNEDAMDGLHTRTDFIFSITILDDSKKDIYDYIKTLREKILGNKTGFYYIPYVTVFNGANVTPARQTRKDNEL